jgi:hypothetical protein
LDADGARLVADEREQATIARARKLRSYGLSLRAVAARLAAEGHVSRTKKRFLAEQVARGNAIQMNNNDPTFICDSNSGRELAT